MLMSLKSSIALTASKLNTEVDPVSDGEESNSSFDVDALLEKVHVGDLLM